MNTDHLFRSSPLLGLLAGISALTAVTTGVGSPLPVAAATAPLPITSYRSASCGCCKGWFQHMRDNGFQVRDVVIADSDSVKRRLGVPSQLASCHSAQVAGYVLEGHVPAADVKRLLRSRPPVVGLAVPGMVLGSPGMESAKARKSYGVAAFSSTGRTSVFSRHFP